MPHKRNSALIGAGAALAVTLLVWAGMALRDNRLEAALMRADPDRIPAVPPLSQLAVSLAKPAYRAHCARCHGADLQGNPELGTAKLTGSPRLYGSGKVSDFERTIAYGIRSGAPKAWNLADMPAFGRAPDPATVHKVPPLSPSEIDDLTDYVLSLGGKPADPDATLRGRALFADKGQCFDCHSGDGKGDSAIGAPDLTDDVWLYGDGSRDAIIQSISRGRHGTCPAWENRLSPATIRALSVYIYTRSHPRDPS